MATETLLAMFPPVPAEQWERTIRETVAGPDYAAKLIWHPEEGLAVRPYYRADDLAGLSFLDAGPGEFPFVRGTRCQGGWRICEKIDLVDPEEANQRAIEAIAAGAEEVAYARARIESESDIALLLANLNEIPVHIGNANQQTIRLLLERLKNHPHLAGLSTDINPLADIEFSAETLHDHVPDLRPFLIDAESFQENGAGAIEEIGFALSAAVDFLGEMQDRNFEIDRVADAVRFRFAVGPEFFIQIAKLRAFRMVWAQAAESFGCRQEHAKAVIHASPSHWDKTLYDAHINVLRSTTEALSAVLGGADSISIAPFDECSRPADDSSRRLARNTQIILKHEALLDRVADPVGGSYLVEVLTNAIATKAWKLFQELENAGGYRKAKDAGIITPVLARRAKVREDAVATRRRVLTGTNRFANVAEKSADLMSAPRKDASPRVAERFEDLRRRTERHSTIHGRAPVILLAEIGDPKMRSARSQFAADFLACAGLATEAHHFENLGQIAGCGADLVALCSSDAEYLGIAQNLMPALHQQGSQTKVIVAGNPDTVEELRNLGIIEFIHLRSNAIEALTAIQQQLAMKD
ncbi:MAG TPA: methylmalonyl-CoA mutase family protein [Terracidiphilus sp.]|jgi:methylmalonyl-CoA mutase